jgi:hypothetical protein
LTRWIHYVAAFVLLASVLAVFISPVVDLEPSALRALQFASLLFAALVSISIAFVYRLFWGLETFSYANEFSFLKYVPDLLDLTCTRLC